MLCIPINQSLLYIRPLYVEAESQGSAQPQLKRVIAVFSDRAVMKPTLQEALADLFPGGPAPQEPTEPSEPGEPTEPPPEGVDPQVQLLSSQLAEKLTAADQALAQGKLGEFEALYREARDIAARLEEALNGPAPATTTTTTTTTTTPGATTTTTAASA